MTISKLALIGEARRIGQAGGLTSVIILQELPDGRWGYTSWGKDIAGCKRARLVADEALSAVEDMFDLPAALEGRADD